MAPSILIVGVTGNIGRSVTETLPGLLKTSGPLSNHWVTALTRSLDSSVAKELAELPGIEMIRAKLGRNYPRVAREHEFAKSTFHLAARQANVEYVVKISTTAANVCPDSNSYYARSHWAVEALLASPEFERMQWSSLQPNIFSQFYLAPAVEPIQHYRKTGERGTLKLIVVEHGPVSVIDPDEVGVFVAHLLAQDDTTAHNKANTMIERRTGVKVNDVSYRDLAAREESKNVILSGKRAMGIVLDGKCASSTTSKEVLELAAPKRTKADALKTMLSEQ
ncbi:hypothetical protein BDW75DRAFT_234800 [Aspergillus navahoensis]